jgi:3-hydroxyacyl-CoA dehydrogenase
MRFVQRPSPEALAIIEAFRSRSNLPRRDITDQEIIERTLYPMVNEGHQILEEGKAQRASDIDVVWVHGYGWPAYRGGPMFWGDQEGAGKIAAALSKQGIPSAPSLKATAG